MTKYKDGSNKKIDEYVGEQVRKITYCNTSGNKPRNYIAGFGRADIKVQMSFLRYSKSLTKSENNYLMEIFEFVSASSDYVKGFTVEFTYPKFKHVNSNRSMFSKTKKKFVKDGLLIPIPSTKKIFMISPDFIIKGKAKQPIFDELGNVIAGMGLTKEN